MDLATDLVYLKKLLMSTEIHYQDPHTEAMRLKVLWTYAKTPNKEDEPNVSKNLLAEATKLLGESNEQAEKVLDVIRKGLRMDPRSHQLYALRGEIYAEKRDWQRAMKCYETARKMLKFEKTPNDETISDKYNEELRNAYRGRGEWHEKNERLIEAAADYEQVLVLRPKHNEIFQLQDMLLKCLRKLDKYEAYRSAWSEFVKGSDQQRIADLMTQHAEFKIHTRELSTARRMLREALSMDKQNMDAQNLLQVIFDTGHTMLAYAIIWCINGCYDKALMTIDKGTDCDPYNPGFTVLKTIVLRLSGRLTDAIQWLDSVNDSFYKLLEPSFNERGSIMGNITVEETKAMLIDQWYLIRYDMAVEHMINGRYEAALNVLRNEKLLKKSREPRLSMGDCLTHQGNHGPALEAYLKAHEESIATGDWKSSEKNHLIAERIAEIFNSHSRQAIQTKQGGMSLRKAEDALNVFKTRNIPMNKLGSLRSEALMYEARSDYRISKIKPTYSCLRALADSLSFGRGADDGGMRDAVLGDNADLEKKITCFGSKKKFPYCTKILMQN